MSMSARFYLTVYNQGKCIIGFSAGHYAAPVATIEAFPL